MRKAKVAIITRTKDRPIFLVRALQSVSAQTYDDYVHVIVNDGGDKSEVENIVTKYDTAKKVQVFHREKASGAPDTIFNESIDKVDSEYVAIHDDDDTWHPDFLKQTVHLLGDGAKGVVVRTDKIIEKIEGDGIRTIKMSHYMPDLRAVSLYRQCIDNQLTPIAFIYRRDAYVEAGKYDASLPVVGDWEFGIRFLQKYDVEYLDPGFALANYHHRKDKSGQSFADHSDRKYLTQVANKYLRQELNSGQLGVGFIMSSLRHDQDTLHGIVKRVIPRALHGKLRK